jgi:hypothetical protein
MSEVDIIADELVYVVEPVEQLQLTLYPQVTDGCSPTITAFVDQPLPCDGVLESMTSSMGADVTVRLRHRPPANASAALAHRGSFYASGTLSANASREQSPDGQGTVRHRSRRREVRRICDYPVAPPSMIITPSRTPMRSQSTDRSRPTFNASDLCQRLSDIVDVRTPDAAAATSTGGRVSRGRSVHRADAVVNSNNSNGGDVPRTFGHVTGNFGRSLSVSPRTARRQFYDDYPTTLRRPHPNMTSSSNSSAPSTLAKSRDKTFVTKRDNCSLEFCASTSPVGSSVSTLSTSSTNQLKKSKNRMSILRLPALSFFRKKSHNHAEHKSKDQLKKTKDAVDLASDCSMSSSSDVTDITQQLRHLKTYEASMEASLGCLKDKQLSRSQPLQSTNHLTTSYDALTLPNQSSSAGITAQLPPLSGVVKTPTSSSTFGSGLAARLMDPLKKRRQRVTSVGELPITSSVVMPSAKETVSVTSLAEVPSSRLISRRRRRVLSNAFMQGSL